MKRKTFFLSSLLAAALLLQPGLVSAAKAPTTAPKALAAAAAAQSSYPVPIPPEIAAKAYLLLDVSANGQVLAAKNADQPVEPASLTKLMTAYVVFDALKNKRLSLEQKLRVSEQAKNVEGSRMFVDVGWQVPVEDLLKGLIVQSGNDAAHVLAEGVGGSVANFVQMMNHQAPGYDGHTIQKRRRTDPRRPYHHGARLGFACATIDARLSPIHWVLRHQALPLSRHAAEQRYQPQYPAVP